MTVIGPEGEVPAQGVPRRRLRLDGVDLESAADGHCLIAVRLEWCGRMLLGEARALETHHGKVRASAEAALSAALSAARGPIRLELVGVKAFRAFDGWVVVVRVLGEEGGRGLRLLGAASTEDDGGVERAAAQAVLDATNRVVEGWALP